MNRERGRESYWKLTEQQVNASNVLKVGRAGEKEWHFIESTIDQSICARESCKVCHAASGHSGPWNYTPEHWQMPIAPTNKQEPASLIINR
jgi:hypothetical protein